jgi:hypothetical protein
VWIKDENGLPSGPYRLLIARNVLKPEEVKFFLSNAPEWVAVETLLLVAFSRWRIERLFEDTKDELGMDHFEVRRYVSIQRHLLLTCVSYLFLAEFHLQHRGEKSGSDRLPGANRDQVSGPALGSRGPVLTATGRDDRGAIDLNATAPGGRTTRPPQANHPAVIDNRSALERPTHMQMAVKVA